MEIDLQNGEVAALSDEALNEVNGGLLPLLAIAAVPVAVYVAGVAAVGAVWLGGKLSHILDSGAHYQN